MEENIEELNSENPLDVIKRVSEERAMRAYQDLLDKQIAQQKAIQSIVDRKIRENNKKNKELKKINSINDVLKKGERIRWEIVNNGLLKGFVNNKLIFEIKRGMTIYNLYIKDNSFLKENIKVGYFSCASEIQKIKNKSESLLS